MLAVAAVSKWANVGMANIDVAADVDVAAEARSAVVRKAGTRGTLWDSCRRQRGPSLYFRNFRVFTGHHGTNVCKQWSVFCKRCSVDSQA